MPLSRLAATILLGLTTLLAGGFALYQYQRAEALTVALAQATQSRTPLPEIAPPVGSATRSESAERHPVVELTNESADESSEADEASDSPQNRFDRAEWGHRIAQLMADPEYARAFQLQQRARLDNRYAALFAQLDLPPTTLARLQDLLAEKQTSTRDVFMAAREEGFNGREDREQIRTLIEATQAEIDAEIKATIGEQNFTALQNFEETGRQRAVVNQLETRLSYSATPLNSAQAAALTTILAQTTSPGTENVRGRDNRALISDQAIAQAQGVLAPDQLNALQALQAEQTAAQKVSEALRAGTRRGPGSESGDAASARPTGG